MLFDPSAPVAVSVPATSANLGPGFDSLGLALNLWNHLELRPSAHDELVVKGEGEELLSGAPTSLVHLAARSVFNQLELNTNGFHISMHNAIPFARGLGSSSAAIVGGLVAANEWARRHEGRFLSKAHLLDLATRLEGHPDNVAPALQGGLCVCATREDGHVFAVSPELKVAPKLVVWIPSVELSTEKARAALPSAYLRADCVFNLSRSALLVAALTTGDFDALAEALRDRVHQEFRAPLVPGWNELSDAARGAGALGMTLSGAGPTLLFWLHPEGDADTFVEGIDAATKAHGLQGRVVQLDVVGGARVD